jgi:hypothetical protein
MAYTARLITPQGQTIPLSPQTYESVLKFLEEQEPSPVLTLSALRSLLEETQGKYAGHPSMVRALLAERRAERQREEARRQRRRE